MNSKTRLTLSALVALPMIAAPGVRGQNSIDGPNYEPPDGDMVVDAHANDFRPLMDRFKKDLGTFEREFPSKIEPKRIDRMEKFHVDWVRMLDSMDFDGMNRSGQVDYILYRRDFMRDYERFKGEAATLRKASKLVPFMDEVIALERRRRAQETYDNEKLAAELEALSRRIDKQRWKQAKRTYDRVTGNLPEGEERIPDHILRTAADGCRELQKLVDSWYAFYRGYDPLFSWWLSAPSKRLSKSIGEYADAFFPPKPKEKEGESERPRPRQRELRPPAPPEPDFNRERHTGPVGARRLAELLRDEMIPYTAAEIVELGNRELAWCIEEQKKASRELGFGDDVAAALEHVKKQHVPIGEQPAAIRKLALEAIDFLEKHELITIPQLAKDSWRIGMMSPDRQRYNPFFTGGSTISVSYPHEDLDHSDKLMSMRGNNPHFSAATVHHELIPGHHLQGFMNARYNTHRGRYRTPFWTEGWALYWEMLLWDLDFPRGPEDKMGFLFWRMHRCARITFSLGYHLGEMTPQQCVDLLVKVVGHEPTHAKGEVRRSLRPGTPILYQCAYMLGGMQFYALHKELVKSGKMTNREFHDRVMKGNNMPVEMVRAEVSDIPLTRDYKTNWRFGDEFDFKHE